MRLHRSGRGQIKTAQQLAEELAIPIYYLLVGQAQAAFPETSTPAPSSFVQVVRTGQNIDPDHVAAFPAYVNWRQWDEIVVPLIEGQLDDQDTPMWSGLLGYLGGATGIGAITRASLGPGVYTCNRGLRKEYLNLLREALLNQATSMGYAS